MSPLNDFNDYRLKKAYNKLQCFTHRKVPMRDGVSLSADVTLPSGKSPFPAILMRTPYDNSRLRYRRFAGYFANRGYAFVVQDVRGRGDSQGNWEPNFNEGKDGYDTVEWVASQPWCNGKVGMMGGSYVAQVQWMAAKEHPPHLTALSSTASPGKWMEYGNPYQNGVPSLEQLYWCYMTQGHTLQTSLKAYEGVEEDPLDMDWPEVMYHLPLRTMDEAAGFQSDFWRFCIDHPDLDENWFKLRLDDDFHTLNIPVLHITGWLDDDLIPTTFKYENMVSESQAPEDQALVIGPWDHPGTRDPQRKVFGEDFGEDAVVDLLDVQHRFFDHHLKNKGGFKHNVRLFVLGINSWVSKNEWPPKEFEEVSYFLRSKGSANSLSGDGYLDKIQSEEAKSMDQYTYDPNDPTPAWPDHKERWAPQDLSLDQRFVQKRDDVLVYTSDELKSELNVSGTPSAEIFLSSNVRDTDLYVTLSDVYPDGRSIRISWNVLRARYRDSLQKQNLMNPGEIYKFSIDLMPVCNVFKAGHKVRLAHLHPSTG